MDNEAFQAKVIASLEGIQETLVEIRDAIQEQDFDAGWDQRVSSGTPSPIRVLMEISNQLMILNKVPLPPPQN
jgi:hypothetical protein